MILAILKMMVPGDSLGYEAVSKNANNTKDANVHKIKLAFICAFCVICVQNYFQDSLRLFKTKTT